MRGRNGLVALVALAMLLTACGSVFQPIDPAFQGQALTTQKNDTYSLTASGGIVTLAAPTTNQGGDTRAVFYPTGQTPLADEQSCATWSSGLVVQQGVTLRLRTVNGVTRAVTVTKNIFDYSFWVFNVHVWDTSTPSRFTLLAQFDLSSVFIQSGMLVALPWDVCARVVGNTLTFEAWVDGQPPPAWGDTTHGGSVTLPAAWNYPGYAGWYVGHLQPGGSATYTNLLAGAPTPSMPATMSAQPVRAAPRLIPIPSQPPRYPPTYP